MIRRIKLFAIGMATIGSFTSPSFGQTSAQPVASPAQAQPAQVAAPVQAQPAAAADPAAAGITAEEKAVRETLAAYVATYNQKDAARLVEFFSPDGTLIDSDNVATRGREAIAQQFSEAFADASTYTLEGKVERFRLITPDVAQVEGVSRLVSPKEATIANHFVALLARKGRRLETRRDSRLPSASRHRHRL